MSTYKIKIGKIGNTVEGCYKKIENAVIDGYKKVENKAVKNYEKIEKKFVDTFLEETASDEKNNIHSH